MDELSHVPKWVWIAAAAVLVLVVFIARRNTTPVSAAAPVNDIGPNQAALDAAQIQADAGVAAAGQQAKGSALSALIQGLTSALMTSSSNAAGLAATQAAAGAGQAPATSSTTTVDTITTTPPTAPTSDMSGPIVASVPVVTIRGIPDLFHVPSRTSSANLAVSAPSLGERFFAALTTPVGAPGDMSHLIGSL